jgi:hypothetical protein
MNEFAISHSSPTLFIHTSSNNKYAQNLYNNNFMPIDQLEKTKHKIN